MKMLAETPNVRLVCDGKHHYSEDKKMGVRYRMMDCDCKTVEVSGGGK